MQYFPPPDSSGNVNEDVSQRVTYYYDNGNGNQFTQNGMGRLSEVDFGGGVTDDFDDTYQYLYSYNTAGRVTSQQMNIAPEPCPYCFALGGQQTSAAAWAAMTANYQWDNEGRMTSLQYPTVNLPHQQTGAAVSY